MKSSTIIPTTLAIIAGIAALVYVADYGVSTRAIPSLGEFLASSTAETNRIENNSASTSPSYPMLTSGSAEFRVLIADTPATRELGLSGRMSLARDEGMLFIFPTPGRYGFWMKDMNFPIDIVWIDDMRRIIGITENISPDTYPNSFFPPSPTRLVLEINAGSAKESGLAVGGAVSF